jgi:hypothetical protein
MQDELLHTKKFQSTLLTLLMLIKEVHSVLIMLVSDIFTTSHAENLMSVLQKLPFSRGILLLLKAVEI